MSPSFLLAALPPPDLTGRVRAFRASHALRDAADTPHVTVKARRGLNEDLHWVPAARAVVAATAPLTLTVGGPAVFGNGSALFLRVESVDLVRLHVALLDALRPALRFGYEGPHLTPHLSVALARRGLDLPALLPAAQAAFADLTEHPLTFTAQAVTLMRKPGPGAPYQPAGDWLLGTDGPPGTD